MATSRVLHILTIGICFLAVGMPAQAQIFGPRTTQPPSGVQQASANVDASQPADVQQTGWPSIPMPTITMPKITMPNMSTFFAPVRSGYSKMTAGTRKAWQGTKEMFTFGQAREPSPRARRAAASKPSFWQRLVGPKPQPRGPQTVAEWMSQPRLDP